MILSNSLFVLYVAYTHASPIIPSQAVTALISPPSPPPPGCTGSLPSGFGIAVMNISISSTSNASQTLQRRQQPPSPIARIGIVNEIADGQVQGGLHTITVSFETSIPAMTVPPVTQIGDGQVQDQTDVPELRSEDPGTITVTICGTSPSSPQFGDSALATSEPFSSTFDADPAISASMPFSTPSPSPSITPESPRLSLVSCLTNSTLRLTLRNNILQDAFNRTGYIASNFQFQFDGPPQSGAIWTSGWSICPVPCMLQSNDISSGNEEEDGDASEVANITKEDGVMTLALGGTTTFWQCLSGTFYNLYTENWAAQCSPVELRVTRLVACSD